MLKKWPDSQATSQAASSARSCRRRGFIRWLSAVAVVAIHITATPSLAAKPITDDSGVDRNFEAWLSNQGQISLQKLMANISPKDGEPGVVLASPSRRDPDYYFHWVRDAALVMNIVVDQYEGASFGERLEWWRRMDDFVKFSRANQISPAPTGLGEPKFHVDGRPYTGPWGRPQNDGPALRALVLTRYAKTLLQANQWSYVRSKLYDAQIPARTVIKADLEYVAHGWREANFDLWEEVMGDHFYTRLAQLAALREGAELARKLHEDHGCIKT